MFENKFQSYESKVIGKIGIPGCELSKCESNKTNDSISFDKGKDSSLRNVKRFPVLHELY